jgi:hypothetical protein
MAAPTLSDSTAQRGAGTKSGVLPRSTHAQTAVNATVAANVSPMQTSLRLAHS